MILAPNLGLVRISSQIAADRYSYIAMMGVVALVAAGLSRLWQGGRHVWPAAAVCCAAEAEAAAHSRRVLDTLSTR